MKIGVVFPSVMYRNGPEDVQKLIRGIEDIGFDQFDMFDHVVMGYPTETRPKPFYSPQMPIMEALTMLSYAAAITEKITLGTGTGVTAKTDRIGGKAGEYVGHSFRRENSPGRWRWLAAIRV